MKRFLLVVFITLAGVCHGQSLVDLTPGGYEAGHFPPVFWKLNDPNLHFFDEAGQGWFDFPEGRRYINGWISLYGDLNGGQYFFTNLFILRRPTTATIWWNFIGSGGYSLGIIHTWGRKSTGIAWEHLYLVRDHTAGEARVTVDGNTAIQSIAFYGYEQ